MARWKPKAGRRPVGERHARVAVSLAWEPAMFDEERRVLAGKIEAALTLAYRRGVAHGKGGR